MTKKKLTVKPPIPKPVCCKTCLVQAACSIEEFTDCPDAWAEIMKIGSYVYWPITCMSTKEVLLEEGYTDEEVELLSKIRELVDGIRKGKLTIRPATKYDRNIVKFVVTEF